ncbi:MAG: transketolase [Pseudomonadota bacterium]
MNCAQGCVDELCINTLRMLSADAVQQAKSGHPGLPLGAAPMVYVLWSKFIRHNPENPHWPDRDRFIMSAGHGSALLYATLHLFGYEILLEDLKNFRQWGSKTPGHPEYNPAHGIEATTGPLGQGFAMGVGMALAERFLSHRFNRPGVSVVDHYTYALVSDGDLMEGISYEAASLAGHLGLGKIVYLYDDNHISIEGDTSIAFTEDVEARFKAFNWHVLRVQDGNDTAEIEAAIRMARDETAKPSLIMVRTHIGYGSPKQDKSSAHGEPLGDEGLAKTKEKLGWPLEPRFHVPDEVRLFMENPVRRGKELESDWNKSMATYREGFSDDWAELHGALLGEPPLGWDENLPKFAPGDGALATRAASGKALNALAGKLFNLMGGSADLAPSNQTVISTSSDHCSADLAGRNLRFGVREHSMAAIVNGMALHGGLYPYCGTFLVFSDYMRPSLRLAALMGAHSIFILTHDSIGVGEDGPTHQPIEHVCALRAIPDFTVLRPADANETVAAWRIAIQRKGPVALILTRQNLPILDPAQCDIALGVSKGAYVASPSAGRPDVLIIASGSEVHLGMEAQRRLLTENGIKSSVISMPSWELFLEQPREYRDAVLPPDVKARAAIEAGTPLGWREWVGDAGDIIAIDHFGASAPAPELMKRFGFTADNVVERIRALLGK